jgi:transposase-like protein
MRTASEKLAIIRLVEDSELSVRRTLAEIRVSRTSFYRWYSAYEQGGLDGLENQGRSSLRHWNRIPNSVRSLIVAVALDRPDLTPRELAWHISGELKTWLKDQDIEHTRGAPYHPQTQGKIERYHRSMKNVVKLEHYYYPWELEKAIAEWVEHYNHERYHESLDNVTLADAYEGRRNEILDQRAAVKARTMTKRKIHNLRLAG